MRLDCLKSFRKRVAKAPGRFRHPCCRSAHSILTMGGYTRVNSMSCCGTFRAVERPYAKTTKGWCQRRRFCASCAWWASRETVSKFLRQCSGRKGKVHALHLSWIFPDDQVGIAAATDKNGDEQDFADIVEKVWQLVENALRRVTRRSDRFRGALAVESLTATQFLPLRFNPHFHGLIYCDEEHREDFAAALEQSIPMMDGFEYVSRWVGRTSIRLESIPTSTDLIGFLNYCFAAFGLGRAGSCIDDVYQAAWTRCQTDRDRIELNRQVAFWVKAFDHACFDRRRTVMTGLFWHRHRETLRSPSTDDNRAFVDELYSLLEEEETTRVFELPESKFLEP